MFQKLSISLLLLSSLAGSFVNAVPLDDATTAGAVTTGAATAADTTGAAANGAATTGATTAGATTGSSSSAIVKPGVKAQVYKQCNKPGQFVITFDDGPNPATTPIAIETLKKYGIRATFFVNGINWSNLEQDPSAVQMIKTTYEAGHDIGSHTYYHKDLFEAVQDNTLADNVDKMTETIKNIIGVTPAYFRPPNGSGGYDETDPQKKAMSDQVQQYLGERGYNVIMWGTDTMDWQWKENVQKALDTMNEQLLAPGISPSTHSFITLLHDVHPTTVNLILPAVIEYVKSLGYTFVPLSECIGIPPYQDMENDKRNLPSVTGSEASNMQSNSNATDLNSGAFTASQSQYVLSMMAVLFISFIMFF